MTAPRECRPPEGTPDGTLCVLRSPVDRLSLPPQPVFVRRLWDFGQWLPWSETPHGEWLTPTMAYTLGYRFHSIAEPPHE